MARKLGIMKLSKLFRWEKTQRDNFKAGMKEGYPLCCLVFHTGVWMRLADSVDWDRGPGCWCFHECEMALTIEDYLSALAKLADPPGYIPCPACLVKMIEEQDKKEKTK